MNNWFGPTVTDKLLNAGLFAFIMAVVTLFIIIVRPKRVTGPGGVAAEFNGAGDKALAPKDDPKVSLLHHRFFKLMDSVHGPAYFIQQREHTNKAAVNAAFLYLKFTTFRDGIRDFIERLERKQGDGIGRLPELIVDLVHSYELKAETLVYDLPDGQAACGIPRCYIVKFGVWHNPHARLAIDGINSVIADRIYPDWWARAAACLEYLYMAFILTIEDGERTLPQLNGDLDEELERKLCRDRQ